MSDIKPEDLDIEVPDPGVLEPPEDYFKSTFLDSNEDIEIEEGGTPPEETPPTVEDDEELKKLKSQLKEQQEKIAELSTRGQIREELAPLLNQIGQQQQPIQQQPRESDAEFSNRIDENYLETGLTGAIDEVVARRLRPEVQRLLQNNLYNARQFAILDPEKGPLYKKYRVEVDRHIAELPAQKKLYDPEVYNEAIGAVAALHGDEILNERVASALEAAKEEMKAELRKELGVSTPTSQPVHSATSTQQPAPVTRPTGTRMSLAQLKARYPDHVKAAFDKGVPIHRYFKYLAKKGELKK